MILRAEEENKKANIEICFNLPNRSHYFLTRLNSLHISIASHHTFTLYLTTHDRRKGDSVIFMGRQMVLEKFMIKNKLEQVFTCTFKFAFEGRCCVINDSMMWMTTPTRSYFLIQSSCFFNGFLLWLLK